MDSLSLRRLQRRKDPRYIRELHRRNMLVPQFDWLIAVVQFIEFLSWQDVGWKPSLHATYQVVIDEEGRRTCYLPPRGSGEPVCGVYPSSLLGPWSSAPLAIRGYLTPVYGPVISPWFSLTNEFWGADGAEQSWM